MDLLYCKVNLGKVREIAVMDIGSGLVACLVVFTSDDDQLRSAVFDVSEGTHWVSALRNTPSQAFLGFDGNDVGSICVDFGEIEAKPVIEGK